MAEKVELPQKRRKLSLKEKKLSVFPENQDVENQVSIDEMRRVDVIDNSSDVDKEINKLVEDDDSVITNPDWRDLKNKLLKLRKQQNSCFVQPECHWPSYKRLLLDNEPTDLTEKVSTSVENNTSRGNCVTSDSNFVTWPKPCVACLTSKPYPQINILEETMKNMESQKMDFREHVSVSKENCQDSEAGNFELMDIPISEEEPENSSPKNLSKKNEAHSVTKEKMTACPMCQMEFNESLGTMAVDSHLAQCLAAAGDDDFVW